MEFIWAISLFDILLLYFSSHLSDINYWTSGGCFAVNLWHGVGIKKLSLQQLLALILRYM